MYVCIILGGISIYLIYVIIIILIILYINIIHLYMMILGKRQISFVYVCSIVLKIFWFCLLLWITTCFTNAKIMLRETKYFHKYMYAFYVCVCVLQRKIYILNQYQHKIYIIYKNKLFYWTLLGHVTMVLYCFDFVFNICRIMHSFVLLEINLYLSGYADLDIVRHLNYSVDT